MAWTVIPFGSSHEWNVQNDCGETIFIAEPGEATGLCKEDADTIAAALNKLDEEKK